MNIQSIHYGKINPQILSRLFLSKKSIDVLDQLRGLEKSLFSTCTENLSSKIHKLTPTELSNVLHSFFAEEITDPSSKDPLKQLERLASIIPLEKLQEAVQGSELDALEEAKSLFEEANLYLQQSEKTLSSELNQQAYSILSKMTSVIESFILAFGIGDFFEPATNKLDSQVKSGCIMNLLYLCNMLISTAAALTAPAIGVKIIGGTFLLIAALSLIWPSIKPKPAHLPANAQNWTREIQKGHFNAEGRKESLDQIAKILKMNHHAILVGPSRVGKSLTAKAFAKAIENGNYPELQGKIVFRINTTDLTGQQASYLGGGNDILNRISKEMGRHRKDIILVLDEVHMACKNNEKIADQLKTFLDEGGKFPHVIGITTEEEYDLHIKNNNAFSLRFDRVDIKNTDRDETLKILSDTVLKALSRPLVEEDSLVSIYERSLSVAKAPQPTTSLNLLKRCIHETEKTQLSPTEKKINDVSIKILSLQSQAAAMRRKTPNLTERIEELKVELGQLQKKLAKEQQELKNLFQSKNLLDRVTRELYSSALKVSSASQNALSTSMKKHLKIFILLQEFLSRPLEAYVKNKAKALGINVTIDEKLIEKAAAGL